MNSPPSSVATDLQRALDLLRTGQSRPAHALLSDLIRSHPETAEAHWLLAGLLFKNGNIQGAYQELRTTLTLAPKHAGAYALLGEVLVHAGRLEEAESSFRRALVLQPGHLPAATNLGYTLLDRGLDAQALKLAEEWLHRGNETSGLLMLKGRALLGLGRSGEAVATFEHMLRIEPQNLEGELGLAAAMTEQARYGEAEKLVRDSIANHRSLPESHFLLAQALNGQKHTEEAVSELRKAIHARPKYFAAHIAFCELEWMRTGDIAKACVELDAVLGADPSLTPLRIVKGKLLETAHSPASAIEELEAGLPFAADDFELCLAIAQSAVKCDPARAFEYAQRALRRFPENRPALFTYCGALLGAGKADEAEGVALKLHQADINDSHALALLALAWRLMGDSRYSQLYDYTCVVPQIIDTPHGWKNLADYLADLASGLRKLHELHTHPLNQSLRAGTQADLDFANAEDAAIKAFPHAIDGPIRRYMARIGSGSDELRRRNTGSYKLNGAWSVRLRPQGHHVNHIHPDGWLSSACYIELPGQANDNAHEGWIQFGQPPIITSPLLAAEHFIKPQPGLLVLFPSCMWHGTVPFEGAQETARMTIAFDVVPA